MDTLHLYETLMPVEGGGPAQPVRRFRDQAIQKAVEDALANVDEHSAVLDVDFGPTEGVRWTLAAKLNGHWSIGHIGHFKGKNDWGLGARVIFKWS